MRKIAELDVVELIEDQPQGLVSGARGTVVAVHTDSCSVEFVDAEGFTLGLFEIPARYLVVIQPTGGRTFPAEA